LFTKGPSMSQKDLIAQRTETSGQGEGTVGQTPSRLHQLARDDGPGVTNDLNPTDGHQTGRSPNRLQQPVRDNNLDVADKRRQDTDEGYKSRQIVTEWAASASS
jgi:hypothetical protein